LRNSSGKEIVEREDEEFKDLIYLIVEKTSSELGAKVNNVYFRKMRTKWASCSNKKNLHLPEDLIEYVIFHEIVHLIEKRHNANFWNIILSRFDTYKDLEKDLFEYWFLIQQAKKSTP